MKVKSSTVLPGIPQGKPPAEIKADPLSMEVGLPRTLRALETWARWNEYTKSAGFDRPQTSEVHDGTAARWALLERETYRMALAGVLQLVRDIGWSARGAEALYRLYFALEALDQGKPHPAFVPATRGKGQPPLPHQVQRLRAAAAALLEALRRIEQAQERDGPSAQRAEATVTRLLKDTVPQCFGVDESVTGSLVETWRKKLSKHAATYEAGQENYQFYLNEIENCGANLTALQRLADALTEAVV